jgi:3,4-dihydroxy 2-butanone 4-phosphate synthase/GTP cyclohydrolase II
LLSQKVRPEPDKVTLVRVHEPALLLDVISQISKYHSWPLDGAMKEIAKAESGVAVLLNISSHKTSFHLWEEQFIDPVNQ